MSDQYLATVQLKFKADAQGVGREVDDIIRKIQNKPIALNVTIKGASDIKKLSDDMRGLSTNVEKVTGSTVKFTSSMSSAGNASGSLSSQVRSASNSVSELNSKLAGSVKQFQSISGALNDSATGMERFGHQVRLAGQRFLAFSVATAAIFAVTKSLRDASSEAIQFDKNLNKIIQVSDASTRQVREFGYEILAMSRSLGVSSKEMVEASLVFIQAGLSIDQTRKAMEAVAKTQLAPNFDNIKQTTEGAIAAFQQFGKNADNIKQQLGAMNSVAGQYAVEAGDLVTVTQKAGGAFASLGGNLEDLLGLFTSVRATTRESAESISTGLRTIFTRLQRQDTVDAMRDLGINLRFTAKEAEALGQVNLTGQFVGAYDAVKRLSAGLSELKTSDPRFSNAIESLGGYRQISRVIPLLKEFGVAQQAVNTAKVGEISLDVAKEQASKRIETRLTKIAEGYKTLFNEASQTKSFDNMLSTLEKIAEAFQHILANAGPLIPVLGGLALGAGITGAKNFARGVAEGPNGIPRTPTLVGNARRFASGGVVPGSGRGDKIPAMLEPGEVVISNKGVQSVGYGILSQINSGTIQKFAGGGVAIPKEFSAFDAQGSQQRNEIIAYLASHGIHIDEKTKSGAISKYETAVASGIPRAPEPATFASTLTGLGASPMIYDEIGRGAVRKTHKNNVALLGGKDELIGESMTDALFEAQKAIGIKTRESLVGSAEEQIKVLKDALVKKLAGTYANKAKSGGEGLIGGAADYVMNNATSKHSFTDILDEVAAKEQGGHILDSVKKPLNLSYIPKAQSTPYQWAPSQLALAGDMGRTGLGRAQPLISSNGPIPLGMGNIQTLLQAFSQRAGFDVNTAISGGVTYSDLPGGKIQAGGRAPNGAYYRKNKAVELNPSLLGNQEMLIRTLAHETGHGVHDMFSGGIDNKWGSDIFSQIGRVQNKIAKDGGLHSLFTPGSDMEKYRTSKREAVADAVRDYLLGIDTENTQLVKKMLSGGQSNTNRIPLGMANKSLSLPVRNIIPNQGVGLSNVSGIDSMGFPIYGSGGTTGPLGYGTSGGGNRSPNDVTFAGGGGPLGFGGGGGSGRNPNNIGNIDPYSGQPYQTQSAPINEKTLIQAINDRAEKRLAIQGGANVHSYSTGAQLEIEDGKIKGGSVALGQNIKTERQLRAKLSNIFRNNGFSRTEAYRASGEAYNTGLANNATVTGSGGDIMFDQTGLAAAGYGHVDLNAPQRTFGSNGGAVGRRLGDTRFGRLIDRNLYADNRASRFAGRLGNGIANNTTGTAIALSGVASYAGEWANPNADQIKTLGTTGSNDSSYTRRAAAGGALQGAAFGASVGIAGGPWGAAIGAVIGSLVGLSKSLSEAADAINEAKLGLAVEGISKEFQAISQNRKKFEDINGDEFSGNIDTIRAKANRTADKVASRTFGSTDPKDYGAAYKREIQIGAGSQLINLFSGAQGQAEKYGKDNYKDIAGGKATIDELGGNILKDKKIAASVSLLVDMGAYATTEAAIKDLGKEALKAASAESVRIKVMESGIKSDRVSISLTNLADAAHAASQAAGGLNRNLASIEASLGHGGGPGLGNRADVFGSIGSNNAGSLNETLGLFNRLPGGGSFSQGLGNIDKLASVLPSALSTALQNSSLDETLGKHLGDALMPLLGAQSATQLNPDMQRLLSGVMNELDALVKKDKGEFEKNASRDTRGAANSLLGRELETYKEQGPKIVAAIIKSSEELIGGHDTSRGFRASALNNRANAANVDLELLKRQTEFSEAGRLRPASDILNSVQLEGPYQARQGELLGGVANDPAAIVGRIGALSGEINEAAKRRDNATGTPGFKGAEAALSKLLEESDRLKQALSNLADASARTATAQEKLASVMSSISSRRSFIQQLIMSDPAERFRLRRNAEAANDVTPEGFAKMSRFNQQGVISGLSSLGQSRLANGETANKKLERLLDEVGGTSPNEAKDKAAAEAEVVARLAEASEVLKATAKLYEDANTKFLDGLEKKFDKFLADMNLLGLENNKRKAQSGETGAGIGLNNAVGLQNKATWLGQFGINNEDTFNQAKSRKAEVLKLWQAEDLTNPNKFLSSDDVRNKVGEQNLDIAANAENGFNPTFNRKNGQENNRKAFLGAGDQLLTGQSQDVKDRFHVEINRRLRELPEGDLGEDRINRAFNEKYGFRSKYKDKDAEQQKEARKEFIARQLQESLAVAQAGAMPGAINNYNDAYKFAGAAGQRAVGLKGGDRDKYLQSLDSFDNGQQFSRIGDKVNDFTKQLKEYTDEIGKLTEEINKLKGGGIAPQSRGSDKIPAMLSPGEVVMPAHAVQYAANGGWVGNNGILPFDFNKMKRGNGEVPAAAPLFNPPNFAQVRGGGFPDLMKSAMKFLGNHSALGDERAAYQKNNLYNLAFEGDESISSGFSREADLFRNRASGRSENLAWDYSNAAAANNRVGPLRMAQAAERNKRIRGFASGGMVPGSGMGDKVHAMLEPGEIIMSRQGVANAGAGALMNANSGGAKGAADMSGASAKLAEALETFSEKVSPLTSALNMFGTSADKLIAAMEKFPSHIEMTGTYKHEVIVSGADALKEFKPEILKIANKVANDLITLRVPFSNLEGPAAPGASRDG